MKKIALLIFIAAIAIGICISYATGNVGSARSWIKFGFGGVKGSGNIKTETRDVPKFTGIDLSGAIEMEVTAQKSQSVEIETDDNILPLITTEVKNGMLYISNQQKVNWSSPIKVRISVENLDALNASGVVKVNASGIKSDKFTLDASGASKINLDGDTNALSIDTSGASVINAENLKSVNADVDASGACKVSVYASESVDADASGVSKINYSGSPKTVNKKSSGASSVSAN
jgi:hypothetical protein